MARLTRLVAAAAIGVLLLGVPAALLATGGDPLPSSLPTTDGISALWRLGPTPTDVLAAARLVAWLAWLRVAIALAGELVRVARHQHRPARPARPSRSRATHLAGWLVGLAVGAAGPAAGAAPPASAAPAVTLEVSVATAEPAPATVRPLPAPADAVAIHHTVSPRDTLWQLAERSLGRGDRWRELVQLNAGRLVAPGTVYRPGMALRPGWDLLLPPPGTAVVEPGDTLGAIASRALGEAGRWRDLWQENRGRHFGTRSFDDPDLVLPGWVLRLPDPAAPGAPAVGGPGSSRPVAEGPVPVAPVTVAPAAAAPADVPSPVLPASLAETPVTTAVPAVVPTSAPAASAVVSAPAAPVACDPVLPGAAVAGDVVPWRRPLAVGGGVLLATGAAGLLASRRRRALRSAPPRSVVRPPDAAAVAVEQQLVAAADPLAVARLDLALRHLVAASGGTALPAAVLHGPGGAIDVHLVEPCPPVAPWTGTAERWSVAAEVPTASLVGPARTAGAPCPALVSLGTTVDGREVHLDVEALGLVAVDGPAAEVAGLLHGAVTALAVSPLAEQVVVVTPGGPDGLARVAGVETPAAAIELAEQLAAPFEGELAQRGASRLAALRVNEPDEVWGAVVVVLTDADAASVSALEELAGHGGRGVGCLVGGAIPVPTRIVSGSAGWRVEPFGIDLAPHRTLEPVALAALFDRDTVEPAAEVAPPSDPPLAGASPPPPDLDPPLLVRVLGPVEVTGSDGRTATFQKAKALELVAWLAEHRRHPSRAAARAALWEVDVRDATFANVVSEARRALAEVATPPGTDDWLGRRQGELLPLHPSVRTDVELVTAATEWAAGRSGTEVVAVLRAALSLVRGAPYAGSPYLWPDADGSSSTAVLAVTAAATELARRCLASGDLDGVFDATATGLEVLPGHEELVCLRFEAHAQRGDLAALRAEYAALERVVTSDPWGDEVSPKILACRARLLRSSARVTPAEASVSG